MSAPTNTISSCCLRASLWEGTPTGTETKLAGVPNPTYVARPPTPSRAALLYVHDMLGWTFPNARLLADAYAREAGVTVYVPDFFGGEVVPAEPVLAGRFDELDVAGFAARNAREVREPEVVAFARALRASGEYDFVAAVGFCYGGWAVLRLGSAEFATTDPAGAGAGAGAGEDGQERRPLVDVVSAAHPSWLVESDVEGVTVPVQILATEHDPVYTPELKAFTFSTLQKKGLPFDYQHFPGIEHGALVRGSDKIKGEREAMVRAKNALVAWLRQWIQDL
ncbi:hypothetical protein MYCTH_2301730 [Thermothelomyces thermophilus ATCC 42464]|uniref:Dienelactone hydrolase domain-containing protein n=1 Tax=Thermothelomyces thermophilus (strain ATCC 42464 / BCRC 31852 / DSM 1799) TaxID=573729 RepID=G2QA18_THET4|nr:uncharacterized protein MYCTH_2301730 [Thermothelomyces thermophilus ATCC 42464]AEO56622.1 hypothetical protein MYCTH_2301730 [Thermothelomyces thermophilus ATCC 42464]